MSDAMVMGRRGPAPGWRTPASTYVRCRLPDRNRGLVMQQLADPEIQQLGRTGDADQDIAGLQIAMHHEVLMRVFHCRADVQEQYEALANPKPSDFA